MGTFIKEQRIALGMTQQQLAEQLHITNKAISRWETGNAYPDIALLDDLAAALSVSVEELCRGERIALPSADTNTLLSDVITEVRQQKKDRAAKWLRILCLSIFSVILLAFLFFTGAFLFIQNEANLDEALFTLALGAFAIGLMLFRDGIPILLLASTAVTLQTPPAAGEDHRLYPAVGSVRPLADLWRTLSLVAVILAFPSFCIIFPSADDGRISIKRILFLITFQTVYSKFLS